MRPAVPPAPAPDPQVRRWIRRQLATTPPRAPSLIITVWGDAIAPHGGAVMLAGLIALLAPFGINERLVRTSVFRLAREGWLKATPVGRGSLYRLTRDGARRFEQAYRRIYAPPVEGWDDTWELVIADGSTPAQRRALEQELGWEGFGTLAPGVYARPATGASAVPRIAAALRMTRHIVVVRARDDATLGGQHARVRRAAGRGISPGSPRTTAASCCGSAASSIAFAWRSETAHDPAQAFVVRTLLIHAYRRVLLRDPQTAGRAAAARLARRRGLRAVPRLLPAHAPRRRTASAGDAAGCPRHAAAGLGRVPSPLRRARLSSAGHLAETAFGMWVSLMRRASACASSNSAGVRRLQHGYRAPTPRRTRPGPRRR